MTEFWQAVITLASLPFVAGVLFLIWRPLLRKRP